MVGAGNGLLDGRNIVQMPQAIDEFVEQSLGAGGIDAVQAIGNMVQKLLGLLQIQTKLRRGQGAPEGE